MKKKLFLIASIFSAILSQDFYNPVIDWTGTSQLIIFQNTITGLEAGDEIGIFDSNGVIDDTGATGELLVGPASENGTASAVWSGNQLEPVAIGAIDLSQFGGPILPGYVEGNPLTIKVYRASTGLEYNTSITYSAGTGTFGDLFIAISNLTILEGDGCTDSEACNYDETALVDDGSCAYTEDCEGNCGGLATEDCSGECNGLAQFDNCGVCSGGSTGINPNSDQDCAGECFGTAIEDCTGECGGNATIDECGVCNGNNLDQDCNGDCFGNAYLDFCNVCSGGNSEHEPNTDIDECGVCFGDNSSCSDCNGTPNGDATEDCSGECNGDSVEDMCGICDSDASNDCIQDCSGEWGGSSELDECGVCDGSGLNDDGCCGEEINDCTGECGGNATIDECGVCNGNNLDQDCNGDCFGDAQFDACGYCDGQETNSDNCISYNQQIQPIFDNNCTSCHSYGGQAYYQVFLTDYNSLMAAETWYNNDIVIPGDSQNSFLIHTIEGTAPIPQMPIYQDPLDQEVIDLIALWIDQGALNDSNDDGDDDGIGGEGCTVDGEIEDCDGNCYSSSLIGDGNCNNGDNETANFYCAEFIFDCALSLSDCEQIPDCPVGELYFGDLDQEENRLPVYMDCQYPVNSYTFSISGLEGITLSGGMLNDLDLITESDPLISNDQTITWTSSQNNLSSNYGLLFYVEFNSVISDICFSNSYITTSVNIEYEANYGDCITFDSLDNDDFLNPDTFIFRPAFPNPFNPLINIPFSLFKVSDIKIDIYDLSGNKIENISDQIYSSGTYNLKWDASGFSSGTYFIVAEFGNQVQKQKIVLMK